MPECGRHPDVALNTGAAHNGVRGGVGVQLREGCKRQHSLDHRLDRAVPMPAAPHPHLQSQTVRRQECLLMCLCLHTHILFLISAQASTGAPTRVHRCTVACLAHHHASKQNSLLRACIPVFSLTLPLIPAPARSSCVTERKAPQSPAGCVLVDMSMTQRALGLTGIQRDFSKCSECLTDMLSNLNHWCAPGRMRAAGGRMLCAH